MAVYTEVSLTDAQAFIVPFQLGELTELKGIQGGIENTNYYLSTDQGDYVLTIFERLNHEQLPFYLELMRHLASKGIYAPAPQAHQTGPMQGEILHTLKGKPAALATKLKGRSQLHPQEHHCAQLGKQLAQLHLAGQDFDIEQPNLRGLGWQEATIPEVIPFVTDEQALLLQSELAYQQSVAASASYQSLPRGAVHADLFRDNALFDGASPETEKLSGIFDFYFAGTDTFLFDLAVCLNDWCIEHKTGVFDAIKVQALLNSYQTIRPLTKAELELLPAMLRSGALRFWLSRLWDFYLPREAALLQPHDPNHFERILKNRIEEPFKLL